MPGSIVRQTASGEDEGWPPAQGRGDDGVGPVLHRYAIALGSNRPSRLGSPADAITAALAAIEPHARILACSNIHTTPALGPARRRFANAAALTETDLPPTALLALLKRIERRFGRRPGQRWGDRVIDLDIALWSGGIVATRTLAIPHRELTNRRFVLDPLAEIAPGWRLPGSQLHIRHLHARLTRARLSA